MDVVGEEKQVYEGNLVDREKSGNYSDRDWRELEKKQAITVTTKNFAEVTRNMSFLSRKMFKLLTGIKFGEIYVKLPAGMFLHFGSGQKGKTGNIILKDWHLILRAALGGTIGIAESYIAEEWDSPNLAETLEFFVQNEEIYKNVSNHHLLFNLIENIRHWFNRNTYKGAKRNIASHYDLGNRFYKEWLDPSMTYSSALYDEGANSLESAQQNKYRHLINKMGITKDSHVLEIGCGWGGFAEYVAQHIGARVTGLTLSREQLAYARQRLQQSGLDERTEIKFQDYRDETGKYDFVVSIEMFEAVGEKYWPTYFKKIHQCLKPNGKAGLQIITMDDNHFETYRRRPDFIQRYIFPGGMLPSPSSLESISRQCGLVLSNERIFPQDYARTLHEWYLRFNEKWHEIRHLGFDDRFRRMWNFYLTYCEAGFRHGGIDVRQLFYERS